MNKKNNQPTKLEHQRKRRGRNKDEDIYMNYKRKREKSNQSIDTELILKTDDFLAFRFSDNPVVLPFVCLFLFWLFPFSHLVAFVFVSHGTTYG